MKYPAHTTGKPRVDSTYRRREKPPHISCMQFYWFLLVFPIFWSMKIFNPKKISLGFLFKKFQKKTRPDFFWQPKKISLDGFWNFPDLYVFLRLFKTSWVLNLYFISEILLLHSEIFVISKMNLRMFWNCILLFFETFRIFSRFFKYLNFYFSKLYLFKKFIRCLI